MMNAKFNEHPRCGCRSCRRGAGTVFGQFIHKQTNRKIRHDTKRALRNVEEWDLFMPVRVSTPMTD